jgi:hypothetical protein
MRGTAGYLIAAVAFALAGAVFLRAGLLNQDLARVDEQVVAGEYDNLTETLAGAERYYGYASRLPWIGDGPLNDIRARKAALQYWQRRYAALAPQPDPFAELPEDNVDLQFLVANAVYRHGVTRAQDRAALLAALDAGISGYLRVLANAVRHHDAAYNYEYLLRVRDEIERGRRKPGPLPEPDSPHGRGGAPQKRADMRQFKVYVPLDSKEIEKGRGAEAGKAPPIKRKG